MKPFLVIDRTSDDNNRYQSGAEFCVKEVTQEIYDEYMSLGKKKEELEEKLRIPKLLLYAPVFCLVLSVCTFMFFVPYLFKPANINEENAFGVLISFVLFICGLVGFFVLKKVITDRQKNFFESKEYINHQEKGKELTQKICKELQIPDDYISADIIFFHYKSENGQIQVIRRDPKKTPYDNDGYFFYIQDNTFYVASCLEKYAVNLDAFTGIRKVNEFIKLPRWTKPEPITHKKYAQYNLTVVDDELLMDTYYILEFTHEGQVWGLYFPCYELPVFENLTGLKAET